MLDQHGEMPLPPYIDRAAQREDEERYQTVYARAPGAVAAPTAGLHFDQSMLDRLREQGVALAFVTLHVGAGTFQPVRSARIEEHVMHSERYCSSRRNGCGHRAGARERRARRRGRDHQPARAGVGRRRGQAGRRQR